MLLLLAALTYLVLISELVLPSDPLCPCRQEGETLMRCEGWADWCPRAPLPSTSLLAITFYLVTSTVSKTNHSATRLCTVCTVCIALAD